MTAAVLELQGAIVAALKNAAAVTSIAGERIYDHVPRGATGEITARFPFVAIASSDELTTPADCIDQVDVAIDIDCWSRAVGFPEVRRLADAVRRALHDVDLALSDNALVLFQHRQTRTFRDADGLTSHAVLSFEAALEVN